MSKNDILFRQIGSKAQPKEPVFTKENVISAGKTITTIAAAAAAAAVTLPISATAGLTTIGTFALATATGVGTGTLATAALDTAEYVASTVSLDRVTRHEKQSMYHLRQAIKHHERGTKSFVRGLIEREKADKLLEQAAQYQAAFSKAG